MTDHQPITPEELQTLKKFWAGEDKLNGGRSDTTRLVAEVERLNDEIEHLHDVIEDAYQSLEFDEFSIAKQQLYEIVRDL